MWSAAVACSRLAVRELEFLAAPPRLIPALAHGATGWCDHAARTFGVAPWSPHAAHTRFHELAHLALEPLYRGSRPAHAVREVEADAVAALCCAAVGAAVQTVATVDGDSAARVERAAAEILRAGLT